LQNSQQYLLQPRLGAFVGKEASIPYDFHEVLALIAPRPLLIVAPQTDRSSNLEHIKTCCREVSRVYELLGSGRHFELDVPDDYNRLSPELQRQVIARLKGMMELNPKDK